MTATLEERGVADARRRKRFNATYVCGHCQAGVHANCRVTYPGGIACNCKQDGHPPLRCRDCNAPASEGNPLDEATIVCLNRADCVDTVRARLDADPLIQMLRECQTTTIVAGEVTERPRRASKLTTSAARAVAKPGKGRACACGCDGTTKGGAFLPGHDSRYVSTLAKQVASGELAADVASKALADWPALQTKLSKRTGGA